MIPREDIARPFSARNAWLDKGLSSGAEIVSSFAADFVQHSVQQLLWLRRNIASHAAAKSAVNPQQTAELACGLIYLGPAAT
jgi:hypothetical protein